MTIFAGLNCHCGERHTQGAAYYVSCRRDDGRHALLAGPYAEHHQALDVLDRVNRLAQDSGDPRACWYSYGTLAVLAGSRPDGVLNAALAADLARERERVAAVHTLLSHVRGRSERLADYDARLRRTIRSTRRKATTTPRRTAR